MTLVPPSGPGIVGQRPRVLLLTASGGAEQWRTWLAANGWDCSVASRLNEAVDAADSCDMVIVDGATRDAGWVEAASLLRQAGGGMFMPLVFCGLGSDEAERARLLVAGADAAVAAAGPGDELLAALHALLRTKASFEELEQRRQRLQRKVLRQCALIEKARRRNRKLRNLAISDPLTGIYNGRYFQQWLKTQLEIARRYRLILSLLVVDIDHFKAVNDNSGHPFGDYVLTQFAQIVSHQTRSSDVVARCGGDEFVIGLVETSRQEAIRFGRRLLTAVAGHSFEYFGKCQSITISIGQAGFPEDPEVTTADQLLVFADQALYQAKRQGRNRLVCWHEVDAGVRRRLASRKLSWAGSDHRHVETVVS